MPSNITGLSYYRTLTLQDLDIEKGRVLLIAANPSAEEDVGMRFRLHEVLETAADNTDSAARWQISALFGALPGGKERILATADELEKLRWTIKRDLACGGGLLVLEFEAIPLSLIHIFPLQRNSPRWLNIWRTVWTAPPGPLILK